MRPPIAPVREVLVDDYRANFFPFNRDGNSDRPQPVSYDAFRNLEQESRKCLAFLFFTLLTYDVILSRRLDRTTNT